MRAFRFEKGFWRLSNLQDIHGFGHIRKGQQFSSAVFRVKGFKGF